MNIKDEAREFAIKAHKGQVRKSEPDKPMIIHPIGVAKLLESYDCDDNVIAAGYLHDVVEDTNYTEEDIKRIFGTDVAALVMDASEEDKSLSWEERKEKTIEKIKHLPLRNKVVICADKINNLEDIMLKFQKNGERDFSSFNRGEEKQKWYYENVYNSLIIDQDKNFSLFKRLKEDIDYVFYNKDNEYLKNNIFNDDIDYYERLKKLNAEKEELKKLRELCSLDKPFIIEFCGTPRTGKTTIINNLDDFFKKGNFNTEIIPEFTTSKYYKAVFKKENVNVPSDIYNLQILEEVARQLLEQRYSKKEIIIIDRSINDRQIWNYRQFIKNNISKEKYIEIRDKYINESKELISILFSLYANPDIALKRDYINSLALEDRRFININNLSEYNSNLLYCKDNIFNKSVDNHYFIDTSFKNTREVSVDVTSKIMKVMRKKYIKAFEKKYNL